MINVQGFHRGSQQSTHERQVHTQASNARRKKEENRRMQKLQASKNSQRPPVSSLLGASFNSPSARAASLARQPWCSCTTTCCATGRLSGRRMTRMLARRLRSRSRAGSAPPYDRRRHFSPATAVSAACETLSDCGAVQVILQSHRAYWASLASCSLRSPLLKLDPRP